MIQFFIKRYRKRISLRRRRIGEHDLLRYLKSDYVKFIEEESKKATDINALMRGSLLELLVALYFSKKGFDVHVRYKSSALGKEYDVVAIKEAGVNSNVIHIVECKERSVTTDPEEFSRLANEHLEKARKKLKSKGPIGVTPADIVFKEILDFRNSIEEVRKNIRKLAHELGIKDNRNIELKGILVTTELYSAPPEVTPDVEFWTWWTLKEKLSAVGIDKSFFEIIEKHLRGEIGRPITDLHFYKDYFD